MCGSLLKKLVIFYLILFTTYTFLECISTFNTDTIKHYNGNSETITIYITTTTTNTI